MSGRRTDALTTPVLGLPRDPCRVCGERAAIRDGRCWRCGDYWARHDRERPNDGSLAARYVNARWCLDCGQRWAHARGRCTRCYKLLRAQEQPA